MINISELQRSLNKILSRLDGVSQAFNDQQIMNRLGLTGTRYIKKRTREGTDIHGKSFAPYSERHAKRRDKLGLPMSPVNLQMTDTGSGGMMNQVTYEVGSRFDSVSIGFQTAEKEALMKIHSVLGAGRKKVIRNPWGFTDQEERQLINTFAQDFKKLILAELQ